MAIIKVRNIAQHSRPNFARSKGEFIDEDGHELLHVEFIHYGSVCLDQVIFAYGSAASIALAMRNRSAVNTFNVK